MSTFNAAHFANLQQFLRAYLHQDYVDVHGSPAGAARDFCKGATPARLTAVQTEFDAFLALAHGVKWPQTVAWWTDELGSSWVPADTIELSKLRAELSHAPGKK
jgi:hypothetical protein